MRPKLSQTKVKYFSSLNNKKQRDTEGLFIASGMRTVSGILDSGSLHIELLVVQEDKEKLLGTLQGLTSGHPVFCCPEKEFTKICTEKSPQGICAIVKKPVTQFNAEDIAGGLVLFFDRINDPGNLGTIIRSAAWFGFNTIMLSAHSADPFQPKVVRSTAGAIGHIRLIENCKVADIRMLKEKGFTVYATRVDDGSDIAKAMLHTPSIFLFGSEAHGLDRMYDTCCNSNIHIARSGHGESLNVATAAAILMYQTASGFQTE